MELRFFSVWVLKMQFDFSANGIIVLSETSSSAFSWTSEFASLISEQNGQLLGRSTFY